MPYSRAGLCAVCHREPRGWGWFDARFTEILDNMTELYTAASGIFLGAEYANWDGSNERRDIIQPCLCVYGTTTPLHFWGALQGANVVDGSLARLIILPSEEDYPDENRSAGLRRSPRPLIEGLQRLAEGGGQASGNLAGRTSGPETAVDPMTVPMDDEAQPKLQNTDAPAAPDTEAVATRAREAERDRVSTIYDLAGRLNLERGFAEDLVRDHAHRPSRSRGGEPASRRPDRDRW